MTIEISPAAQTALDRTCAITGLPKKLVIEGLLEWLADQDPDIQVTIPAKFSAGMKANVARTVLEKMAAADRAEVPTEVSAENVPANGGASGGGKNADKGADVAGDSDANRKSSTSAKGGKPAR